MPTEIFTAFKHLLDICKCKVLSNLPQKQIKMRATRPSSWICHSSFWSASRPGGEHFNKKKANGPIFSSHGFYFKKYE